MQGKGSQEEHTRADRARCKRGCSMHLSGRALRLSTAVCPVLFWNLSLPLHNLALSHVHVCCKEKVPAAGGAAGVDLAPGAGVRLGARSPLVCAVSCWSQGVPVKRLEQGKRVSDSRQMWQESFGSPKAATGGTGLGVQSSNGVCMTLSVCLPDMCSASIPFELPAVPATAEEPVLLITTLPGPV